MSCVALIGGVGKMESRYREIAQAAGLTLQHYERSMPPLALRPALVLVVAAVVSHPQREQAERLAVAAKCPIVYLRTPSQSAVRDALNKLGGGAMISVTAGLGFLIAAFDGCEDGARQDLHRSLSALRFTSAYERRRDYFDRVSAHVLRDGFEVLLCSPEKGKRYKIELILGSLDQLLDGEPAPAPFAPATVRLWAEFIGVVGETAMEQDGPAAQRQWMATAAAWAEGLQRIGRRALADADRRAA